jgi:WD40 repeat protein
LQGFADGVVRITNAKGDELFALAGHLAPILAAAWTSDGKQLATASTDTTVKIWRTANGQELKEVRMHKGPVCALAWSADDSRVATASWDGTVKVWNPASNEVILTSGIASPSTTNIFWAGDGSRLLITKTDSSGASITETCAVGQVPPADRGAAELDGIMLSAPARDGTRILRCLVDGSGQIINAADSRLLATLTGHAAPIMAGAWAADGNQIATASSDTTVRIWNPANGDLLKKLVGHKGPVCAIAWSNDGTMVASAAWDRSVIVWHVRLGKGSEILKIEGVAGMRTTALAWTADDTKLLVTNDDGSSQMLDL